VKILAITSSYPRYEGDSTAPFIESIVRSVAERGHTVHVLLPQHREWARPASEGSVHYHPYRYSPRRSWTPWGFSESLQGGVQIRKPLYALAPIVLASATRSARTLLAAGGFDAVHVHWVVPNGPVGALAAPARGVPLVISLHGSDVAVSERSRAIGRATRWSFSRASAVTAPSGDLLERAHRLGATCALERVPYGADVRGFEVSADAARTLRRGLGFGDEHVVVAGVGRLIPVKGFEYLVEAHAEALATVPQLRLVLVGDGDLRRQLEERIRTLGVADSVVLTGAADRSEIPVYMAAADIVAVPSVRFGGYVDGLPNVALESMAAGKPLVASRVGGLPELVRDGENGLLVPEKDAHSLAEALVGLAGDPELRHRLGASAQAEIASTRSWNAVAGRFVEIYRGVARDRRGEVAADA
jgi:glycosyltransferase involved in cell wall biosynthesis